MAVKIKLKRLGKIRTPQYRIVVADSRTRRDGRAIEEIGKYHPKEQPSLIDIKSDRAQYWLGVGAQPTEPVLKLLKITGDWQKFKGLPGAEGTLKVKEAKTDKAELFNAALAAVHGTDQADATTAKKKSSKKATAKKSAAKKADSDVGKAEKKAEAGEAESAADKKPAKKSTKKAEAKKAEAKKAEAPKAEAPKAEAPKAEAPKAEASGDAATSDAADTAASDTAASDTAESGSEA